jgi:hypothetical protein
MLTGASTGHQAADLVDSRLGRPREIHSDATRRAEHIGYTSWGLVRKDLYVLVPNRPIVSFLGCKLKYVELVHG